MNHVDALARNQENWDERANIHARSQMYDVEGFLADRSLISSVVRNDLSVLQPHLPSSGIGGRSLLHLQCHIGTDTVSWARLGAVNVTGLDLSPNSLHHARRIAERDGQAVTWVQGDARVASSLIDEQFDTVVTSAGTIVWLPELSAWAHSIHDLLTPGGVFMVRDDHPMLAAMEFQPWAISDDYLSGGGTRTYDDASTYTENTDVAIRQTTNYEWRHDLSEVLTALLEADLRIEAVHELPYMDWPAFPGLIPDPRGWTLPADVPRIPLNFAIVARRAS